MGVDAFALNVGFDKWHLDKANDAYNAAASISFKVFLSLDMTSFPCMTQNDMSPLQNYIRIFNKHPAQLVYNGKPLVSTFSGEKCEFGTGDVNVGWTAAIKDSILPAIYFMPAFFLDPATFGNLTVIDGAYNVSYRCWRIFCVS